MTKQYAFFVDAKRCIGCFTCAMACKNQYHQEPGVHWRQVYPLNEEIYPHRERAFYSLACNHCENPTCANVCPVKAYYKREEDGVVVHEQDKCIGCGNCIRSCPYGAPRYNPVLKKAEKCSFCYQRLDAGLKPACVQSCPVEALQIVDLAEFDNPNAVQYPAGFPRFTKLNPSVRFILPEQPRMVTRSDV
ncbi:4Fe-4S dicluster domain-containing protein [Oceanidesulfovibrio marinus]|uniref:4Fe-4S dicluster domain-containing protein n=1 Tax=Oceanidesulfovibrio marinus TaxID=370038 RepID=A0A6P1ZH70_9BACT|nr:4Fe-4S dicluster domain-containing protein [Oceanidesulfovibrio marinus]QJT08694.1 4Fe-4S dicluster domain-containing protein [Oceanidesulfovibrio marinus]TVM32469.1 DMSO reductase [Oceanidesulfovibrio marinus]